MNNDEEVIKLLSEAIASMSLAMPLIEEMHGKISTEILNLLDDINKFSVMY